MQLRCDSKNDCLWLKKAQMQSHDERDKKYLKLNSKVGELVVRVVILSLHKMTYESDIATERRQAHLCAWYPKGSSSLTALLFIHEP